MASCHDEEDDSLDDESRGGRSGKWHLPVRPTTVIFFTQFVVLINEIVDVLGR
ncbi:hypothetical protein H4W33_005679 [Kibdelosporangium phytohabitans]|nr:hypothetical protein [Kibdelosporangium phytohabitans]